jgi:hypothetical protein
MDPCLSVVNIPSSQFSVSYKMRHTKQYFTVDEATSSINVDCSGWNYIITD